MCPKAVTALLMALVSIQLFTGLLLAKPTRPVPHQAARRLIVAQLVPRSARERTAHANSAALSRTHSRSSQRGTSSSDSTPGRREKRLTLNLATRGEAISLHSPRRLHGGTRSPARERAIAAHGEMLSNDGNFRYSVRAERRGSRTGSLRRANFSPKNPTRDSYPAPRSAVRLRNDYEDSTTRDQPTLDSTATGSLLGIASRNASGLSNAGGMLRPVPGTMPLRSIEEEASTPVLLPSLRVTSLYDSSGHLVVPPPLYGSREILLHQNEMADRDGLIRIQDDADVLDLRRQKKLVALPDNETLRVDFRLPENRRFSRPWTVAFLSVLARDYYDSFHSPLQVDSAVRTVAVQQRLIRTNGNAAPSTGDTASPHLTGQAIDIAKGGLSRTQIAWMRTYLQPLIDLGKIDVEEEFRQSCFHISVYRNFLPATLPRVSVAAYRQPAPETLTEHPEY